MRIGIITDIHENVENLQEALRLAAKHHCNELVCLGDIVGFDNRFYRENPNRSAKNCLDLVRLNCRWIVAGNHDLFASKKVPIYSNGYKYPENWFELNGAEKKHVSERKVWCHEGDSPNDLGMEEIKFLKSLPEYITTSVNGLGLLFSHYLYPDVTGSATKYIERNYQLRKHWEFMSNENVTLSFSGHSHTNFPGFAYQYKPGGIQTLFKSYPSCYT